MKFILILCLILAFVSCSAKEEPSAEIPPLQNPEIVMGTFSLEGLEFPDANTERLPFYYEMNEGAVFSDWCVNGDEYYQRNFVKQYFCEHKEAENIASALIFMDGISNYNHHPTTKPKNFDDVNEAENDYLIHCAFEATPEIYYGSSFYDSGDGSFGFENSDHIVTKVLGLIYSETGYFGTEVKYAEDVERTFHYLYGDEAEFKPEYIESQQVCYVPSAEIFVIFSEGVGGFRIPQILSIEEENGIYNVEAVWTFAMDYDFTKADETGILELNAEVYEKQYLENEIYSYSLKKEADGRFILLGMKRS